MGFIYEPAYEIELGEHLHHVGIMYTAYIGFILINTLLLISRVIGDRIPYLTVVLFALNGAGLFLITGILLLIDRKKLTRGVFHPKLYLLTMMTISVSFAFANVVVFIVEAFFTYKRRQDL
jgi:hypothetical protein